LRPAQPALAIGLVLLLAARLLAVVGSLLFFRIPVWEQAFLCWAGLRGAVPILLATFPIVRGVPDSDRLLDIVFVLVVIFTLIQGPEPGPRRRKTRAGVCRAARHDELILLVAPQIEDQIRDELRFSNGAGGLHREAT